MILKNKRVLVVGLGESGKNAINLLKSKDCKVVVFDDNIKSTHKNLIGPFDLAVLSPGIKNSSLALNFIKQNNIPTINEIELGILFCKSKIIIGITGTNGKTTVVSLLQHILNFAGKSAIACGNNGICLTSVCERLQEDCVCILELSSFMLQKAKNLHLDCSCFLNFQPDHLNFHKTVNEYFESKKKIFDFQSNKDFAIVNADDESISKIKCKAKQYFFSLTKKVKGVFVRDENICFYNGNNEELLFNSSCVCLLGRFNLENVCACVLIAKLLKIDNDKIKQAVSTFKPVKHRLNLIYNGNFKIFNDSKATNVASCLASLSCFEKNVILILGGSDKSENFDLIFKKHSKIIKLLIITGDTAKIIKYYAIKNDFKNYKIIKNFKKSVMFSIGNADSGDIVLFSPACASFDHFKNFEHRGEEFEKIVENCLEKNKN